MIQAGIVGVLRHVEDCNFGARGRYGANNEKIGWNADIDGAVGEVVVASFLNVFWDGKINDFKAKDVGDSQVRATRTDYLILHPPDDNDDIFVSVGIRKCPRCQLWGWFTGKEGKQQKWWCDKYNNGRPAFFVPQTELNDMDDLKFALAINKSKQHVEEQLLLKT